MFTKTCKICGKKFQAHKHTQRCCSPECSKANARKMTAKWFSRKSGRDAMVKVCVVCGKEFNTFHKGRKTCSHECSIALRDRKITTPDMRQEHAYRERVRKQTEARHMSREVRLARLDLEHAALHVPVKVTERDGIRVEVRGVQPGGWQGRGKLITNH